MLNDIMKAIWEKVTDAYNRAYLIGSPINLGRLYSCTAWMYDVTVDNKRYVVLRSYNTVIAIWDTEEGILIDALRAVYGYTNTSAQHVSKFTKWIDKNYPYSKPRVYRVFTWDNIKGVR